MWVGGYFDIQKERRSAYVEAKNVRKTDKN